MKEKSNISVIITARWASEYLKLCYETLQKYARFDNEVIIVADYPSWQTLKYIQEQKIPYILTAYGHQFMAWNEGAKRATREYIAIVADDVVFGPDWDVALSELAHPDIVGCLMQYFPDAGYSFGYKPGDIKSFNMEEFINYGLKNKQNTFTSGLCWPLLFKKDLFFKYGGFTYHTGRGHGHDLQLVGKILRGERNMSQVKSLKSFIFHFGPTGNQDQVSTSYIGDYSSGLLVCANCGITRKGFGSDESCPEVLEIVEKGFWLCENCKVPEGPAPGANEKMDNLRLNLGCGASHMGDFINIDVKKLPEVDMACDIEKGLPFPDNSVAYIAAHDFLEHVHKDKFIFVIQEMYRVSKPGAIWNIRVPYWSANSAWDAIGHNMYFTENTFNAFNYEARGKGSTWTLPDLEHPGKELEVWLKHRMTKFNYYGHVRELLGDDPQVWDKLRKFYTNVVDTISFEYEVVKFDK